MKSNLEKEIKKAISDLFDCSQKIIKHDSGPIKNDVPKWDSFGNLELILTIEKKFKIKFLVKEIDKINNFEKLLKFTRKEIEKKK